MSVYTFGTKEMVSGNARDIQQRDIRLFVFNHVQEEG
jgi:hypothetical protein